MDDYCGNYKPKSRNFNESLSLKTHEFKLLKIERGAAVMTYNIS